MIYAEISFNEKDKFSLNFRGGTYLSEKQRVLVGNESSKWARYLETMYEKLKDNKIWMPFQEYKINKLTDKSVILNYLADEKFVPVSENFFYKK